MTRRVWEERRRRVLEPLSFLRAVQLLPQRVLLRLSHLVSLSISPAMFLPLLLFVLLLLLRLRLAAAVAAVASASSRALARVTCFRRDRILCHDDIGNDIHRLSN